MLIASTDTAPLRCWGEFTGRSAWAWWSAPAAVVPAYPLKQETLVDAEVAQSLAPSEAGEQPSPVCGSVDEIATATPRAGT